MEFCLSVPAYPPGVQKDSHGLNMLMLSRTAEATARCLRHMLRCLGRNPFVTTSGKSAVRMAFQNLRLGLIRARIYAAHVNRCRSVSKSAGLHTQGRAEAWIGKHRLAYVPTHVSFLAGRNRRSDGGSTEADASRSDFYHDEHLRRCTSRIQAGGKQQSGGMLRAVLVSAK